MNYLVLYVVAYISIFYSYALCNKFMRSMPKSRYTGVEIVVVFIRMSTFDF